jgi:hypothetical protein
MLYDSKQHYRAIVFWRKTNAAAELLTATYTMAGAVGTPNGITPNGTIQVGQGLLKQLQIQLHLLIQCVCQFKIKY